MTQGRSALFVGINEYRDSEIPNLSAPRNDIDRIRSLLADPDIGGFDIEPLCLNETSSEISWRIDHFFRMAAADKTLLLYFAGHGMRGDEGDLYLCANDTEHDALASTAVEARFIKERIRASPSNHIFVLLDCCYSGRFSRHFRGAENEEIRLDDQFFGPTAGISILSASGWLQQAFENPDYSLFTEALADGLESGDADLDGDGLIDITELHRYMRDWFERVGRRQRPRLLHEEESPAPYFARARTRNARRLFDSARYEQVVLFPANGDASRITKDIVKRYQLGGDFDGTDFVLDHVRIGGEVADVMAYWEQQTSVANRVVIRTLFQEHEAIYGPMFEQLRDGDSIPLRRAIEVGRRNPDLVDRVKDLAGPLRLMSKSDLARLREETQEVDLQDAMAAAGVEVAVDWTLPPDPPLPGLNMIQKDLAELGFRHIGELLQPADAPSSPARIVLRDGVDTALLATAIAEAEARWNGEQLNAARRLFRVLDALDPGEIGDLMIYQVAASLQTLSRDGRIERVLTEAQLLGLTDPEDRYLTFAVVHASNPPRGEVAAQLAQLLNRGRVSEAVRVLSAAGDVPEDAAQLGSRIQGWLEQGEALRAEAKTQEDAVRARRLQNRARVLVPDLGFSDPVAPPPAANANCSVHDGLVTVSWSPSPAPYVRYAVRRYSSGSEPTLSPWVMTPAWIDNNPPINEPLWYAVIVEADGAVSDETARLGPAVVRPEVADLRLERGDSVVNLRWRTHQSAVAVQIFRGDGAEPNSNDLPYAECEPGVGGYGEYADEDVVNGRRYWYRVAVIYKQPDGTAEVTAGLVDSAVPGAMPLPAIVRGLELLDRQPLLLAIEVIEPYAELRIVQTLREPPAAGSIIDGKELASLGTVLPLLSNAESGDHVERLAIEAPMVDCFLVPVTVSADRAAVGGWFPWRPVYPLQQPAYQRRGDNLQVSWKWPSGVHEASIRWQEADGAWRERTVTTATIAYLGVTGAAVTVEVRPVLNVGSHRLAGPATLLVVEERPVVEYKFEHVGSRLRRLLPGRGPTEFTLTVVARQDVRITRLLLVAQPGRTQPLRPDGCDELLNEPDVALAAERPIQFRISAPANITRPYWLACFALDTDVDLRDPPVSNRRIA